MSDRTLTLRIVTPEKTLLEEQVVSVQFPGEDGLFGILPRHASMVSLTETGMLVAEKPGGEKIEMLVHDGFAEVRNDVVTILIRAAESAADIDAERARAAAERARERLRSRKTDYDYARAVAALRRALKREQLAQRG